MFSNTAYEALYQYLGLQLHASFIEVITSQRVFAAVILLIFGVMFFMTTAQFFSRYLPGVLVQRRSIPLSRYVKMVFCLFLGISILKIGSNTSVKSFSGQSWHQNAYVKANGTSVREDYRVSFVFDVLSRSAEEVSALLSRVVDGLFAKTNSQLEAPNFFYKAVMLAGSSTISDPALRESVEFYTDECIEKVLPLVGTEAARDKIDPFFATENSQREIDRQLSMTVINKTAGRPYTCLDAKNEMHTRLVAYTRDNSQAFRQASEMLPGMMQAPAYENLQVSMSLSNLYMEKRETFGGIQKGSQPPSGSARVFQYLNRAFSWDGLVSLFGKENHGAAMAAERSQEFSENLSRAPHVAGFIKMALIAAFPWLVFALVAGHWRVLIYWYSAYFSVLLWTPIWTLLYHIVTGISLSTEAMEALGRLSDGVSLYSAQVVTSRMNYMFAVYSWLQLLVGVAFSGTVLWIVRPVIADSKTESAPEFLDDAKSSAQTTMSVAKGVL